MKQPWTVGVVQLQSTADVAANLAQAEALIRQGAAAGAEALFLPEGFAYLGPLGGRLALAEALPPVGSRTPAGATHPYGQDPQDQTLRLAPSFPPLADVEAAMAVFVNCVRLAGARQRLKERS